MHRFFRFIIFASCLASSPSLHAAETAVDTTAAALADRFAVPPTDDGLPGAGPIRRYDWFKKLWRERRSGWAGRVQQDQNALVFLGDSITQDWRELGSLFPGIKVANRGISGDTTRGVLLRLQEDVLALNPRGIVLLIGTNDLEERAEPETVAGNLRLIFEAFRAHNPEMPVILCQVFPSSATMKRPAEKIRRLNQLAYGLVRDFPSITVLDTYALFADAKGDAPETEFPDLLHPNGIGYNRWEKALRPVLETVGLAPAWPDDFQPEPGFELLCNGVDLAGWSYGGQLLEGKTATDDGRFIAKNGRLVVTVARVERNYQRITTTRRFPKDFELRLEFRASPNADSGIFIRAPQLQCRDYPIAGPYRNLEHYRPLDWNEIVVTVKGGLAHCTCNGEVLVDALPVPADGPLSLESDRGQMEYRRIRVRESR